MELRTLCAEQAIHLRQIIGNNGYLYTLQRIRIDGVRNDLLVAHRQRHQGQESHQHENERNVAFEFEGHGLLLKRPEGFVCEPRLLYHNLRDGELPLRKIYFAIAEEIEYFLHKQNDDRDACQFGDGGQQPS
jgi:hypothetical protein